jgi:hypothetical protein
MRPDERKVVNVGGVWNTHPFWAALSWGSGVDAGVKRLELIAEDWTFTFKTVEQKFPSYQLDGSRLMCRYGP